MLDKLNQRMDNLENKMSISNSTQSQSAMDKLLNVMCVNMMQQQMKNMNNNNSTDNQ